ENLQHIQTKVPIIYYGFSETNDFQAQNINETSEGTEFDVYVRNTYYDTFMIPLYGKHHVLNALSIIAFCHYEEMDSSIIHKLRSSGSVKRTFAEKVSVSQVISDDYAQHPIEGTATSDSAHREYPNKKVVAIFQRHTFMRTKTFLHEFAKSLEAAA